MEAEVHAPAALLCGAERALDYFDATNSTGS